MHKIIKPVVNIIDNTIPERLPYKPKQNKILPPPPEPKPPVYKIIEPPPKVIKPYIKPINKESILEFNVTSNTNNSNKNISTIAQTSFNSASNYFQLPTTLDITNLLLTGNLQVDGTTTLNTLTTSGTTTIPTLTSTNVNTVNETVSSGIITLNTTDQLKAIDGNLFFNDQLLAKAGDIQDIADWSNYPALFNVDANKKDISNVNTLSALNIDFTETIQGADATFTGVVDASAINAVEIKVITLEQMNNPLLKTGDALITDLTINSVQAETIITNDVAFGTNNLNVDDENNLTYNGDIVSTGNKVTSLNGLNNVINLISSDSTVSITPNNIAGTINLQAVVPTPPPSNTISGTSVNASADNLTGITKAVATVSASNGIGGEVDIIANAGTGGTNGGLVSITANGGQLYGEVDILATSGIVGGISTGGLVNITAQSGINDVSLTSAIKLNAASILSYAGAISPIASTAGYNYVFGNTGVSILGGSAIPSFIPSAPGTVFIYGANGISLPSTVYTSEILPYWDGNSLTPLPLLISGRQILALPKTLVHLQDIDHMYMGGNGAITGVNTINGAPYPPSTGAVTQISQGGGSVAVGTTGQITMNTATVTPADNRILINSYGGINISSENENFIIQSNTSVNSKIEFDTSGNILIKSGDNSKLEIQQSGIINLTSLSGSEVNLTSGIIGSGGQQIILSSGPFSPPETGLYVSTADITFNGESLLSGGGVTSFNTASGDLTFNANTPLSLPAPVSNTFSLSFSPAFVPPIPLSSGSVTVFALTDFYNYGQICLNPSGSTPTFNITTSALTSAFKCCYIKNSSPFIIGADVNIQHNGTPITGTTGTSTLHQRTNTNNTGNSILYWDGTDLLLY